ncbi:MAG: hypothetical protein AAGI63_17070 [Planctomycetota bacterium]
MSSPTPPPIERPAGKNERMWPLDVSIVALAGLVLYVITTQLKFDDPRWLFNAWTYIVLVPVVALVLTFLSHGLVTRHVQKSIQLGFLFSVFIHLLLLLLAINVIIFSQYFPDAFSGVKPDRSVAQKTVPEYLFQRTETETPTQPDWSQPVDAETTSRVEQNQPQKTKPLENTTMRRDAPLPIQPPRRPQPETLMRRQTPSESMPRPAESPARLSRRQSQQNDSTPSTQAPTAPNVPAQQNPRITEVDRRVGQRQRSAPTITANPSAPTSVQLPRLSPTRPSLEGARSTSRSMPQVGQSGQRQQQVRSRASQNLPPAGSSPPSRSVSIARLDDAAPRQIGPSTTSVARQGQTTGAQLTNQPPTVSGIPSVDSRMPAGPISRNQQQLAGVPAIAAGSSARSPGRGRQGAGIGFQPAGTLSPGQELANGPMNLGGEVSDDVIGDRLGNAQSNNRNPMRGGSGVTTLSPPSLSGPSFDIPAPTGLGGFANQPPARTAGFPSDDLPRIAASSMPARPSRPRRTLGGPVAPAGSEIAAVESFSRRVMRTKGGSTPSPDGVVGAATEEAIELGLTYLARTQNDDGSWSLQGHGTEVVLRSDTAATGLCLLAFQGAGYTHREHQYIDTVNRGLQFLIRNQKSDGNLYKSENQISDQNVALYSHGIASLALCEAYGMTQDAELRDAAQGCLNYIINTQHKERGGWRYTPQVSADTSVTGWMMMALKSGQLSGLEVPDQTYDGIDRWLELAQSPDGPDRYRYNPFAPDTPTQRHGRLPTPTMTAVGMLMRMYSGWRRDTPAMRSAAKYLLEYPPKQGTTQSPQRDTYYWYYATQVMFHMGGDTWYQWNRSLNPLLLQGQVKSGELAGSWDPMKPVPDRWAIHAGRLYVTTMNLLNLEVYYRHLPIYDDTAE